MSGAMRIKNDMAIAYWAVASLFMVVIVTMTCVLFRDGPPSGHSVPVMAAVFGLFWAFGLGSVGYAFSKPRVLLLVDHAGITVTLRYFLKTRRFAYGLDQGRHSGMVESRDSEGDPHFTTQVTMMDGRIIELKEGSREACEHMLALFESALQGQSGEIA